MPEKRQEEREREQEVKREKVGNRWRKKRYKNKNEFNL